MSWSNLHRLRKYLRKKRAAYVNQRGTLDKYLILYWRYSAKVHGPIGEPW